MTVSRVATKKLLFIVHTVFIVSCNVTSSFYVSHLDIMCNVSSTLVQVTVGFKERSTTLPEDSGSVQISVGLEKEVAVPVSLEVVASNGSALEGQGIVCSKGMSKGREVAVPVSLEVVASNGSALEGQGRNFGNMTTFPAPLILHVYTLCMALPLMARTGHVLHLLTLISIIDSL